MIEIPPWYTNGRYQYEQEHRHFREQLGERAISIEKILSQTYEELHCSLLLNALTAELQKIHHHLRRAHITTALGWGRDGDLTIGQVRSQGALSLAQDLIEKKREIAPVHHADNLWFSSERCMNEELMNVVALKHHHALMDALHGENLLDFIFYRILCCMKAGSAGMISSYAEGTKPYLLAYRREEFRSLTPLLEAIIAKVQAVITHTVHGHDVPQSIDTPAR